MVILGIDPGTRIAGFGILKKEKGQGILLECGYLSLPATKTIVQRLRIFHDFFKGKIEQHSVTHISLETPFLGKNAQNFLKLGYLRGILYLLADQHSILIHEFTPTQIKQTITGFGGAPKEQVARVIFQLLPNIEKPKKEDVTDALAVMLCGLWQQQRISNIVQ